MNTTTRKQFEDAIAALVGIEGKPGRDVPPPVRLDAAGLHYRNATATPPGWTYAGVSYAMPDTLKKAAREVGKPSAQVGEITAIQGEAEDSPARVKMAGVTLPVINQDSRETADALSPGHRPGDSEGADRSSFPVEDVAAVAVAASDDDMRPVLASVHFSPDAVVATDAYRLYIDTSLHTAGADYNMPSQVIHAIKARKAERMDITTDGNGRTVTVEFTTAAGVEVTANVELVDGAFPKYQHLFPDSWDMVATLNTEDAATTGPIEAGKKVARWCQKNRPGVLTFNGRVTLATVETNPGGHVAPVTISQPVEDRRKPMAKEIDGQTVTVEPEPVKIGINPGFFTEAAEFAEAGTIHAISPRKPVMLTQGTRRALVMPVRLND